MNTNAWYLAGNDNRITHNFGFLEILKHPPQNFKEIVHFCVSSEHQNSMKSTHYYFIKLHSIDNLLLLLILNQVYFQDYSNTS